MIDGTVYTDQTGNFPMHTCHGKGCQFAANEYRSDAILVQALTHETDKLLLEAFQEVYQYLTAKGFGSKLNDLDN